MAKPEAFSPQLPDELLELICQKSDNQGLKQIRCSSRHLCEIATPLLFEHWTLYPQNQSFDQLLSLAKSPHLACHLKCLVYDARYHEVTKQVTTHIGEICKNRGFTDKEHRETLKRAWILRKGTLSNRNCAAHALQTASLIQSLGALTNLRHIQIHEPGSWTAKDPLPVFYRRLFRERCSSVIFENDENDEINFQARYPDSRMSYAVDVLIATALRTTKLQSLNIQGINWYEMLGNAPVRQWPGFHAATFSELKELSLTTNDESFSNVCDVVMELQEILMSATELESLSLGFRRNHLVKKSFGGWIKLHERMSGLTYFHAHKSRLTNPPPPLLIWSSRLKRLQLCGLTCTSDELKSVLLDCSSTLRDFELRDLYLLKSGQMHACLVAMLKWIRNNIALEHFTTYGWLTNGGMQNWYIPEETDVITYQAPERLLSSHMRKYMTNGGECPMEFVAIPERYVDLGIWEQGGKASPSFLEETFAGDESWRMVYPSRFFDNGGVGDDSDDDMGFGLFD